MIGALPTTLTVGGKEWAIRSDYRNILCIFEAFEDAELSDADKLHVLLDRMYVDFYNMPKELYKEACEKANAFIECDSKGDDGRKSPKLINWHKDEQMIFPAINAVAGCEVRALEYMHWWTFLGHFQSVDNESLWAFVLSIRQKRSRGKKLEKYETEFFNKNKSLCMIESHATKSSKDDLESMFESLTEGG